MPLEYIRDGDTGFIGLNSRDNPAAVPAGFATLSQNFRMDRGVATVRKGLQRKTVGALVASTVYGSGVYLDASGQENFVTVVTDGIYTYNPQTESISAKIPFPTGETITEDGVVDVISAMGKVFITRGFNKRPLVWDMATTITAMPTGSMAGHQFPSAKGLLYYGNRLIGIGKQPESSFEARNSVSVSNYLNYEHWDLIDSFTFNDGSNDEVIAVTPWTLNEFLVFMRNSIQYVNVGTGSYTNVGEGLASSAFVKTLTTDAGCVAKKSAVQVAGGVMFLSDNGVYMLEPQNTGGNEGLRLLTVSDPISAPIDDVIKRINRQYAHLSVACYWENRYYLAVPLDSSTVNNAILVFNFILKAWESVDTYPAGFNASNLLIAKKDNKRRLYAIDRNRGIFLTEQLDWDEFGSATGTPVLNFFLTNTDDCKLTNAAFTPNNITAILKTRRYTFNDTKEKRYSSVDLDLLAQGGCNIHTFIETTNPDFDVLVDNFASQVDEDSTRRNPVRKIAYGMQIRIETYNLRPSIRSVFTKATMLGKTNINTK
jgi:hypothetical protein